MSTDPDYSGSFGGDLNMRTLGHELLPNALKTNIAGKFMGALHLQWDLIMAAAEQAINSSFINNKSVPADALARHANQRNFNRYPHETDNLKYQKVLIDTWSTASIAGTSGSVDTELARALPDHYSDMELMFVAGSGAQIKGGHLPYSFEVPSDADNYTRFGVLYANNSFTDMVLGAQPMGAASASFGSSDASVEDVTAARKAIEKTKPGHTKCMGVYVGISRTPFANIDVAGNLVYDYMGNTQAAIRWPVGLSNDSVYPTQITTTSSFTEYVALPEDGDRFTSRSFFSGTIAPLVNRTIYTHDKLLEHKHFIDFARSASYGVDDAEHYNVPLDVENADTIPDYEFSMDNSPISALGWTQLIDGSGGLNNLFFELIPPRVKRSVVTALTATVAPVGGHVTLPANPPSINVWVQDISGSNFFQAAATRTTDPSPSVSSYEAPHSWIMTLNIPLNEGSEALNRYFVSYQGESGTGAKKYTQLLNLRAQISGAA